MTLACAGFPYALLASETFAWQVQYPPVLAWKYGEYPSSTYLVSNKAYCVPRITPLNPITIDQLSDAVQGALQVADVAVHDMGVDLSGLNPSSWLLL